MNISAIISAYFAAADFVAITLELEKGFVKTLYIPAAAAVPLVSAAAKLDKKSAAAGGGEHLRVTAGIFRRVYCAKYASDTAAAADGIRIVKRGQSAEYKARFKAWQAERSSFGYNFGNFAEWVNAVDDFGQIDHIHHNTEKGADIITEDGTKIECKDLFGAGFQIPIE